MKTKDEIIEKLEYLITGNKDYKVGHSVGINKGVTETFEEFKKGVESIIKFHEDRIEELIKVLEEGEDGIIQFYEYALLYSIQLEYESIMAIEKEFEGVI